MMWPTQTGNRLQRIVRVQANSMTSCGPSLWRSQPSPPNHRALRRLSAKKWFYPMGGNSAEMVGRILLAK